MQEPSVLVACPDLTADEQRALLEEMGARAEFLVVHTEERDEDAIAALDPETAKVVWEAVRVVIDAGAATTGVVELIRWFRRRRGPSAPIDIVSDDGSIYRLPSDIDGPDGPLHKLRELSGSAPYSYDAELEVMVVRIKERDPAAKRRPARLDRAAGSAKHEWDFETQDWQLSSRFDEDAIEELRRRASGGGAAEALTLALRLLEDPELVDEAITWLRAAHGGDERELVAELATRDLLDRYAGKRSDVEGAADLLRAKLKRRDDDPDHPVRLPLARALARLGRREDALDALATLPDPPLANAQRNRPSATQSDAWLLQSHAALERARLLAAADVSAAEQAYRRCLGSAGAKVVGQAAVGLSRLLTKTGRADEGASLLDGWIAAHGAVAREIGKALEADGDAAGAMRAYTGAGDRDGEAALRLGILLESQGRRSDAGRAYFAARASLNMLVVEAASIRLRALNALPQRRPRR